MAVGAGHDHDATEGELELAHFVGMVGQYGRIGEIPAKASGQHPAMTDRADIQLRLHYEPHP
jgi:hypothetical protein